MECIPDFSEHFFNCSTTCETFYDLFLELNIIQKLTTVKIFSRFIQTDYINVSKD